MSYSISKDSAEPLPSPSATVATPDNRSSSDGQRFLSSPLILRNLSAEYSVFENDSKYAPYFLNDSTIDHQAASPQLTGFTYEILPLSSEEDDAGSAFHDVHYRSSDALSVMKEKSRGHVFAIALHRDNSAFIVAHDSFLNVESYSTRVRRDDSALSNAHEGLHSRSAIHFWVVISMASCPNHVTFAAVSRSSIICFPDSGLFYSGARLLDLQVPSSFQIIRGFSHAIILHFRSLEQLHLFGDEKSCKELRRLLNDALPESVPSNTANTTTSHDGFHAAVDVQTKANFEIFVSGMLDLGPCFGTADLGSTKLSFEFKTDPPSVHDLDLFVSKTRFLENLVELQLTDMSLGPDGAAIVAKMLSDNSRHLTYLSLTRNPLNDSGCACICDSLAENSSLTKLSLGDVNATSITAYRISKLLLLNPTIQTLALYSNPIEHDGFVFIFNSLQTNSSLKSLSIHDCPKFDPACAAKLVHLLQFNTCLDYVSMGGNKIGLELENEIKFMLQSNKKLATRSNWYPESTLLKLYYLGGITKTAFGLELYSNIAHEVTSLDLNNNYFDDTSVQYLCANLLHGFSNLQELVLYNNPIGSKGLLHLGSFVEKNTILKTLSLINCSVEFLPQMFVSVISRLTTCSLDDNPFIPWPAAEVLGQSDNAHNIHQLFYQPIDNVSRDSWIAIHKYLAHRCTEEGLEMFLSLIQFNENSSNFRTPDCARLWITIVGIPFEKDSMYKVIEKFIDSNVLALNLLTSCSDDYGREAILLSVGATQQFLSSRCFFMGMYDIPDGTQHEYKSATCTVYIVDRVDHNKRTRVALKFMKNVIEFEREQGSRSIFVAPSCGQSHASHDFIVETIAKYDCMNSDLRDALLKRRWLVDYDNPSLLVMPAADRNLRIIMDNERITKPNVIKEMFLQILACVKFIHKSGHIHGDLKPRNIVRINRCLKLIDFDASARIGQQFAWTKHSSAYLPPEAIRLSLVVNCDDIDVIKCASSFAQHTVLFKIFLPIDVPIGHFVVIALDSIKVTAVHSLMLDSVDCLRSCASINDHVITMTVDNVLASGAHSFSIVTTLEGNPPAVSSAFATMRIVVNSMFNRKFCSQSLANFISSVRNPMIVYEHADCNTNSHALCSCDNYFSPGFRSVDKAIPVGCLGLCGVAHITHDMWALGVILYRFCARQSLFIEDDEDNIKDNSVSGHHLELAQWTDDVKETRLQSIGDTATRAVISKLLEKLPWKRPCRIDDLLLMPFNEMDVIRLKLEQAVSQHTSPPNNLIGCIKDLSTGKFKDAAFGLRTYLKVASHWDEQAACTLQGMQDEVGLLKDCPDCALTQAGVLQRLGRNEASTTLKLASALEDLKIHRGSVAAAVVKQLRSDIFNAGGWYYGMINSIVWPDDTVKVDHGTFFKIFCQPMCDACKKYDLDYSKIVADLNYIIYENAVEKKEWNGVRDHGRAGLRLKDFMAFPQSVMAMLTEAELVALRFYTSHSFNSINIAMRDQSRSAPHPLPGIVTNIQIGLKKLRALGSDTILSKRAIVLWRGMSSMQIPQQFDYEGGTELAPMSTTTDVGVAISYAVTKDTHSALLFRIVTRNNLERGADVQWLSMFPDEAETLFPPLTFLQRTRTPLQQIEHNGVTVTVAELSATLA